jgi:hypothetical protein
VVSSGLIDIRSMLSGKQGEAVRMRRIVQKREMGCGVACVAMLAGVPYRKALDAFDDKESAETIGNFAPALRLALTRLGLRPSQRLKQFRGRSHINYGRLLHSVGDVGAGKPFTGVIAPFVGPTVISSTRDRPCVVKLAI